MMTVSVESDSCTRCGICSTICPMGIITPADKDTLPGIIPGMESSCIACGQCEAFCKTGAIVVDKGSGHVVQKAWDGSGITPALLDTYMKSRRSIRQFKNDPVSRETILAILDICRYAASGCNGQPVEWLVIHKPEEVHRIAELTIEWMRTLVNTDHPLSPFVPGLISGWEAGIDVICRGAPHLLIPHIEEKNQMAYTDGIIALTHADLAAPAFGVGMCWAGFVAAASGSYAPLMELYNLPSGRIPLYALMFGYPKYKPYHIPERKKLQVIWH
ncbi:nitroreductase [Methanospirillum stamsii]|uniref:Nitroreductase n=2 Tax=Methanospirillum stamsii TaxID=1277351 RepID=A0A2V2NJR1_9EURY|nr:nitroreductase [Methanospirillum stamsii]